jgi:HAD superfamily phosphoserine phosphatase-like hydrolase
MTGLGDVAVFLDFDGTISVRDTSEHLLERLAVGDWRSPGDRYRRGELTSRACLELEWAMLPQDPDLLLATAREIPLDPGLAALAAGLRDAGASVTVVSDGFGIRVREECEPLGLPVLTARVRDGRLAFPHRAPDCPCASCGTCKVLPILRAKQLGRRTVLVGDGTSDRRAALVADRVLAKNGLAAWCAAERVAYTPIDSLGDVSRILLGSGADPANIRTEEREPS